MVKPERMPQFNLWSMPWIQLENFEGGLKAHSLEQTLLYAHENRNIFDMSPLVVVGIQRLLIAIAQDIFMPEVPEDIRDLWESGKFPEEPIIAFGRKYANRFDIFSESQPFYQSNDLPLIPAKKEKIKPAAYLYGELPAGTAITHYRHGSEDSHILCSGCAANGLVVIPAFATSGGAGIKPSINGVPPIYVIPGGRSLFEALAASLVTDAFQPNIAASRKKDRPWWKREAFIQKSGEMREVGYLQSLTFPARRVRLHPIPMSKPCSRCGGYNEWGVKTMVFDMGESRPKEAEYWLDPFVAYKVDPVKGPIPIRPTAGKAIWREFASLFLTVTGDQSDEKAGRIKRPAVLDQIAEARLGRGLVTYPFRCVGMRTDMKAKIFEWIDAGFDIPLPLLDDPSGGLFIHEEMKFAMDCAGTISSVFRALLGGALKNADRYAVNRNRMLDNYWDELAMPFRSLVLKAATVSNRRAAKMAWAHSISQIGQDVFEQAMISLGNDGASLHKRSVAMQKCRIFLLTKQKKHLDSGGNL